MHMCCVVLHCVALYMMWCGVAGRGMELPAGVCDTKRSVSH